MKTTLTKKPTSVEFTVVLDKSDLEPARIKALTALAKNIKIPGFRKGKAPANVVEKNVDPNQLASQTLDIAVRNAIPKIFSKAKLQPISMPDVAIEKYVPGEMTEFKLSADIMPEFKLGNFKKLKAKKEKIEIKPTDVDEVLDRIVQSFAETKVVQRKAKLGDEILIDFVGKKDGVAFDGGSAKDFKLVLGSSQFIPGFEEGLVGKSSGDETVLDLNFPEDYHNKELAGSATNFEVLIKQVNQKSLPKLDDELAKKTGAFQTLKELKDDIEKNLLAQNSRQAEEKYKDELAKELAATAQFDAPASLVEEQFNFILKDLENNAKSHGISLEEYFERSDQPRSDWEKDAREIAAERVKVSIALQELASNLAIEVSDEELIAKVTELKAVYKKDETALKQLDDERVRSDIRNRLRVEKTLDALVKANA